MNDAEERISDLEERKMEIILSKQPTAKKKSKQAICDLWNNIKNANLHITGIPKGEAREKRIENVFEETMAKNFRNRYPDTGNTQGSKQEEPKQTYTKIYYN